MGDGKGLKIIKIISGILFLIGTIFYFVPNDYQEKFHGLMLLMALVLAACFEVPRLLDDDDYRLSPIQMLISIVLVIKGFQGLFLLLFF